MGAQSFSIPILDGVDAFWSPIRLEPIKFGARSLSLLNHCQTQIIMGAQSFMDPNSSLFDIDSQARPNLEGADPFGAQSLLVLKVDGSPVLVRSHSSREPNL